MWLKRDRLVSKKPFSRNGGHVHRSNVDVGNRDLARLEEVEQRLERTERRRLDGDSATALVDPAEKVLKVLHDLISEVLFNVIGADDEQSGSSDGLLEVRGSDLDSQRGLDLLVMDVSRLKRRTNGEEEVSGVSCGKRERRHH